MTHFPFNVGEPLAYFITWTSYGTWLHGDERGWNQWGEGRVDEANTLRSEMAKAAMKETAFALSPKARQLVEETITRHCEVRNWKLHTCNARTNHVHVVVSALGYDGGAVRDQFKAWCTRLLKTLVPDRSRFWAEGGSCRCINNDEELEAAIRYVSEAQ